MGSKHSKEEILEAALAAAYEDGLSQLTFGRLARRLGISDRIVVYYFPNKDELVSQVLGLMGIRLRAALAEAFGGRVADHVELTRVAWPVLIRPDIAPIFALFFEVNGMAAAGREPYRSLVTQLIGGWIAWAATFFDGTPEQRQMEAEAAIALIDGLLLLRHLGGAEAGDRAARRLGVL